MRKTLLFATALCLATSTMTQASIPTTLPSDSNVSTYAEEAADGSIDKPFKLEEGDNTVPAEAGTYYFTFTPTKTGYLNITSDNALTDGQVVIYGNKIHASSGKFAKGNSETGSYNVRMEIPYASNNLNYYIVVNKKTATDKADTFKFQMENYNPGEKESTAIELTELPTQATLPSAEGTYFYAINVPANTDKFLMVEAALSDKSSAKLYPQGDTYNATKMTNGIIKTAVNNTTDKTYILQFESKESSPISFKVSYADVEKGSLITSPKDATAGNNSIDFDGEEYFTYTATQSGKLAIKVAEGATVSFPQGTGKYDGEYDTYKKGNTFFIAAEKGTQYLIALQNVSKGGSFTLSEEDFQQGETRSNPIVMEGNTYTLGDIGSILWLQYNVEKDGVIDFACDAPFDGSFIGVATNKGEAISMVDYDSSDTPKYQGTLLVKKGDILYIQVMMTGEATGKKITLTSREAQPGETYTNPIILEKGKTINVPSASTQKPVWVKASLPKGETAFWIADAYINLKLYTTEANIKADEGRNVAMDDKVLSDGSFVQEFKWTMEEAGDLYIKILYTEGEPKLTWADDTASGISNIETNGNKQVSIYTINGQKVNQITGSGVYIIKSNGTAKKVVIKK